MKKSLILISAATFVLIVSLKLFSAHSENVSAAQKASQSAQLEPLVAGPGRVEPISEDIQIGSELSGKLKSVNGMAPVDQVTAELGLILDGLAAV